VTRRRLTRPLTVTLGVLLLAGCGGQTPVRLDVAPATTDEGTPAAEETAGTSARPSPLTSDPEPVVGEDGCATDVATGIVVACHDPAAGPDDD
jgi:hypothetical protein